MAPKTPKPSLLSSAGSIVFFEKDDPHAAEALRAAMERMSFPVVGLILKVKEGDHGDEIVNWMYADDDYVRSLALILLEK